MPDPNNIDETIAKGRKLRAAFDEDLAAPCGHDVYTNDGFHVLTDTDEDAAPLVVHAWNNFETLAAEVERLRGRVTELETLEAGYVKVLREFIQGDPQ